MIIKIQAQSGLISDDLFYQIIDYLDGKGSTRETIGNMISWVQIDTDRTESEANDFCQGNGLNFDML